jgi:hypothetical protein
MTWIKLEDKTPRHPKVAGLSDKSFRAWIESLCYASEFLTDGILPLAFLKKVGKHAHTELLAAGLWILHETGEITIHDYLEHQTPKEKIQSKRIHSLQRWRKLSQNFPESSKKVSGNFPAANATTEADTERDLNTNTSTAADAVVAPVRTEPSPSSTTSAPLIRSQKEVYDKGRFCAFVGARLDIPTKLHGDLRRRLGGNDAEDALMTWYHALDAELESSGESILPDVFKWVEARFSKWRAPKAQTPVMNEQDTREIQQAIEWSRMSPDQKAALLR